MPRGNQLIRQWRLLRVLEASRLGRTVATLQEEVAELGGLRTVYRDLEALQGAGFPLYQEDDGRWRLLRPAEGGPTIPVQPTEMIALLLSEQMMAPLHGSELAEPLAGLRAKLEAMLGPTGREYVERLRGRLLATAPTMGDYSDRGSDIDKIQAAIIESRRLRIHHFAAHRGKVLERTVDPYGFWYTDGAIYLVAFDELRSDFRKFLVDRIRKVVPLDEVFEPDPTFDMNAYVGSGFRVWHGAVYHAAVEFEPGLAHLPHERRFHHTQRIYPLPDGRCRVTFEAAGLPELASWVASFGGMVRAVEPPELVEMVRDKHREGLKAHEEPGDADVR